MKYKLTNNIKTINGITLHQIQALKSFGNVKEGDLGGWIEKKSNLSHEGDCWVYGDAQVSGNAKVYGDAKVYGYALVYGNAHVYGNADVYGDAKICCDALVSGDAKVYGYALVYGNAHVYGNADVYGDALVSGDAWVYDTDPETPQEDYVSAHHQELQKANRIAEYWRNEAERWRNIADGVDDKIEVALTELLARVEHLERKLKQRTDIEL